VSSVPVSALYCSSVARVALLSLKRRDSLPSLHHSLIKYDLDTPPPTISLPTSPSLWSLLHSSFSPTSHSFCRRITKSSGFPYEAQFPNLQRAHCASTSKRSEDPLFGRPGSGHHIAKTSGHKARISLLGGQPSGSYQEIDHDNSYPIAGGYHDREGLVAPPAPAHSKIKRTMMYTPNTTWTWSFMLVTIAQAAIGLALEG